MSDDVLLLDIGPSAGDLPSPVPSAPVYGSWFPTLHRAAQIPAVGNLVATSVLDGVLLEWDGVGANASYLIETSEDQIGPWIEIARTIDTRYLYSVVETTARFFRVTPYINGLAGLPATVVGAPRELPDVDELLERQEDLDQRLHDEIEERLRQDQELAEGLHAQAQGLLEESTARALELAAEQAARQAAVAAAQIRINEILSDSIISQVEKPQLIRDYQALMNELPGIRVEALASEATTELEAYEEALDALTEYLYTLTTPVRWDDTSDFTYIT